jgi:hypothetical protein
MAAWRALLDRDVKTQRGGDCLIYEGRIYVRNTAPYFQSKTEEWAEYFVCANDCSDCKCRVVRLSPLDGRVSYIRRSTDDRTASHSPNCLPSETKVVLRRAKQEFLENVEVAVRGSRLSTIRDSYDAIRSLLLHNRGKVIFPLDFSSLIVIIQRVVSNNRTHVGLPLSSAS